MAFVVDAELTIATIGKAKSSLLAALSGARELVLDARAVREVDLAGLQVLLAAKQEAESRGQTLSLTPAMCSEALLRCIELAGLTAALGVRPLEISHG
jgi:anti-sigma B factor antagonist